MFTILVVTAGCGSGDSRAPAATVLRYFEALHSGNVEGALELLHEDFRFRDREETFVLPRSSMRSVLAWDAAVSARGEVMVLEEAGDTVRIRQRETNDFLELLGVGPFDQRVTFVLTDAEIREIIVDSGTELRGAVHAAIEPVVEWAGATRPTELDGLLEDGRIVYDGESASGWLKLLAEARRVGVVGTSAP